MPQTGVGAVAATRALRRTIAAACAGNIVEWYDFAVYAALAVVVTPLFFADQGSESRLLAAFAVYATAFLVRPLGAIAVGVWADVRGRRNVLVNVLVAMSLATAGIGLLPTYETLGVLAPCLLVVLRAAQGLAAGGELGLAAVFVAESAPDGRRGWYCSWHTATLALGVALGLAVGGAVSLLSTEQIAAGWWRPAFLVALPLGLVAVYLRRAARESALFVATGCGAVPRDTHPVRTVWHGHRGAWLTGFVLIASGSLAFNTFFIFLPNHLMATTDRTAATALFVAVIGLVAAAIAAPVLGALSDRVGRRPIVLGSLTVLAVGCVPIVLAARSGSLVLLCLAQVAAGVAISGVLSVSTLAEMFPTSVRGTGLGVTVGLSTAVVGGTGPLVDEVLYQTTGWALAPAAYVAAVAVAAIAVLSCRPETAFEGLT